MPKILKHQSRIELKDGDAALVFRADHSVEPITSRKVSEDTEGMTDSEGMVLAVGANLGESAIRADYQTALRLRVNPEPGSDLDQVLSLLGLGDPDAARDLGDEDEEDQDAA